MEIKTHCDVCRLCVKTEQYPGSKVCENKMINKFKNGYWHNGNNWHVMQKGRVLTKATFKSTKNGRQAILKNKNTSTNITTDYSSIHHEILDEWRNDISAFNREGQMENFIFYMTTHPFSQILEFSVNGFIIGFSWLIIVDNIVVDQLFPWRKKRYSNLCLGVFENEMLLELWPGYAHFIGIDNEFKRKLGGWTYEGPVELENHPAMIKNEETAASNKNYK